MVLKLPSKPSKACFNLLLEAIHIVPKFFMSYQCALNPTDLLPLYLHLIVTFNDVTKLLNFFNIIRLQMNIPKSI